MKKICFLFLTLLLLLSLCGAGVYAEDGSVNDTDSGTPLDLTGGVVTGFLFERTFGNMTLESYEKGKLEDLYFLLDTITAALDCTVMLPDGQETTALCTAVWNTDTLPLDEGGYLRGDCNTYAACRQCLW